MSVYLSAESHYRILLCKTGEQKRPVGQILKFSIFIFWPVTNQQPTGSWPVTNQRCFWSVCFISSQNRTTRVLWTRLLLNSGTIRKVRNWLEFMFKCERSSKTKTWCCWSLFSSEASWFVCFCMMRWTWSIIICWMWPLWLKKKNKNLYIIYIRR